MFCLAMGGHPKLAILWEQVIDMDETVFRKHERVRTIFPACPTYMIRGKWRRKWTVWSETVWVGLRAPQSLYFATFVHEASHTPPPSRITGISEPETHLRRQITFKLTVCTSTIMNTNMYGRTVHGAVAHLSLVDCTQSLCSTMVRGSSLYIEAEYKYSNSSNE